MNCEVAAWVCPALVSSGLVRQIMYSLMNMIGDNVQEGRVLFIDHRASNCSYFPSVTILCNTNITHDSVCALLVHDSMSTISAAHRFSRLDLIYRRTFYR